MDEELKKEFEAIREELQKNERADKANLDALLRLEMRVSLKELQTNLKETFVYVTHDQVEALSMADRILVLDRGVLQQLGNPEDVYRLPRNTFVAKVLGNPSMNFIEKPRRFLYLIDNNYRLSFI